MSALYSPRPIQEFNLEVHEAESCEDVHPALLCGLAERQYIGAPHGLGRSHDELDTGAGGL